MAEFWFYHMTESRLEDTLPRLIERSLERGMRVAVQAGTTATRDALDSHLWTYREDSFLPHGTDASDHPQAQPVLLTCGSDNVNAATIRFFVDGAEPDNLDGYERGVLMFDGVRDEQVVAARSHWKRLRDQGHVISYWQQDRDGRWTKKA